MNYILGPHPKIGQSSGAEVELQSFGSHKHQSSQGVPEYAE
jgi:hypothetical protein